MSLLDYGWSPAWSARAAALAERFPKAVPARVVAQSHRRYHIVTETGACNAEVTGKFRHDASAPADYPAVGDWVMAEPVPGEDAARIQALLPRRSAFVRRAAGAETVAQVAAANVHTAFILMGLDGDYNLRRLERYLTLVWDSGAKPVVLLNKADLCPDPAARAEEASWSAAGAPVHALSALEGGGIDALGPYLAPGCAVVLLGSSGAGKSTLANRLLGEDRQRTGPVRQDDSRGRHTTTNRELLRLPAGALLIDTPGMRELQLWAGEASVDKTFADIADFAAQCRFRDCTHRAEPGCAVREAIETGALTPARFDAYQKQRGEIAYLARQQDRRLQLEEKQKWKAIHKAQKEIYKRRNRDGR